MANATLPTNAVREQNERIGLALRQARKKAWGVYGSLARTAELAGVSQGTLSAIERGDHSLSKVRTDNLQNFPAAYGMSAQEFAELTGITLVAPSDYSDNSHSDEVKMLDELHRVPVRTMAAAGKAFYTEEAIIDWEFVESKHYRRGMLAVQIVGDSMEPTMFDGDRIYVDTTILNPEDGKIFLVHILGDGFVMKRTRKLGNQWWLMSDNAAHSPLSPDEATIIGFAYRRQPQSESLY